MNCVSHGSIFHCYRLFMHFPRPVPKLTHIWQSSPHLPGLYLSLPVSVPHKIQILMSTKSKSSNTHEILLSLRRRVPHQMFPSNSADRSNLPRVCRWREPVFRLAGLHTHKPSSLSVNWKLKCDGPGKKYFSSDLTTKKVDLEICTFSPRLYVGLWWRWWDQICLLSAHLTLSSLIGSALTTRQMQG